MPVSTLPQPALSTGVAGTGPAFSAYQSSNQSISNTTFTKVTLDVEEFDTNNNFASNRFTPTVAGYYQINGFVLFSTGTATNAAFCNLFKNGVDYKRGVQASFNTANNIGCCVSTLVYFNGSTDYVELYVYQNNGSSNSTIGGASLTYFNGSMVRSA